jgi:hypothetical protein
MVASVIFLLRHLATESVNNSLPETHTSSSLGPIMTSLSSMTTTASNYWPGVTGLWMRKTMDGVVSIWYDLNLRGGGGSSDCPSK